MPIIFIACLAILPLLFLRGCAEEGTYRISYGSFLNYTEVRNVYKYELKNNCIKYSYGKKDYLKTKTYCGQNIEIIPN